MGGTGNPIPDQEYVGDVESLYLSQFSNYTPEVVHTPEQFCPIVCNPAEPDLTFGQSVDQGVVDLNNAIDAAFQGGATNVAVLGYSQSATVATVEMNNLLNSAPPGELSHLNFVLLGDPNSPIGGILDRFQFPDGVGAFSLSPEPQHVPFLDIPLSLGTTPTTGIASDIYTAEYDGWANFPEDPSNILADINALVGIQTVHPTIRNCLRLPGRSSSTSGPSVRPTSTTFPRSCRSCRHADRPRGPVLLRRLRPVDVAGHRLVLRQPRRPRRRHPRRRGQPNRCRWPLAG